MHVDTIVGVTLGIIGFIGILAAAYAVARANYNKQQIEDLRGARDDQAHRIEFLEHENTRINTELVAEQQKVGVLEKIVTGKEDLEDIKKTLVTLMNDVAEVKRALVSNT